MSIEYYFDGKKMPIGNSELVLADRFNKGKRLWSLVPFKALEPMVEVLEFGAKKYSANQWMKGLTYNGVCESLLRHTYAFMEGEDNDPESKLSHLGHMACNVLFLLYYKMRGMDHLDDRYKER